MTKAQAVKHYGSQAAVARRLGLTRQAVQKWGKFPPYGAQCAIEIDTRGRLKAQRGRR